MAEPLPSETAAVAYERVVAQIDALKSHQPATKAEERRCAVELTRLKQAQNDLARQVIEANAAQQIAEIIGNEYTKPTDAARMNGNSNGHARPTDQPNWAQVIAESEVRLETKFATLEQEKSGGITEQDLRGLAAGLVPFLHELLAPLKQRLDALENRKKGLGALAARVVELEARPALTYEGVWEATKAYGAGSFVTHQGGLWHCEDTNVGARPGSGSPCWKLAVKRGRAE